MAHAAMSLDRHAGNQWWKLVAGVVAMFAIANLQPPRGGTLLRVG